MTLDGFQGVHEILTVNCQGLACKTSTHSPSSITQLAHMHCASNMGCLAVSV